MKSILANSGQATSNPVYDTSKKGIIQWFNKLIYYLRQDHSSVTYPTFHEVHTKYSSIDNLEKDLIKKSREIAERINSKITEDLLLSESKLDFFFNNSVDGILIFDASTLTLAEVNNTACKSWNICKETSLHKHVSDISRVLKNKLLEIQNVQQPAQKNIWEFKNVVDFISTKNKDPKNVTADVTIHKLTFIPGESYYVVTVKDISEKVQLENALVEAHAAFNSVFNKMPTPRIVFDYDSDKIIDANISALEFYRLPLHEMIDMRISQLPILKNFVFDPKSGVSIHRTNYKKNDVFLYFSPIVPASSEQIDAINIEEVTPTTFKKETCIKDKKLFAVFLDINLKVAQSIDDEEIKKLQNTHNLQKDLVFEEDSTPDGESYELAVLAARSLEEQHEANKIKESTRIINSQRTSKVQNLLKSFNSKDEKIHTALNAIEKSIKSG